MADPVEGIQVAIDDDAENPVRVDPVTGTIETDQDDGGVVVQLDAHRPGKTAEADDGDRFYRNLVDELDHALLGRIASELHEQISADDRSRGNYLEIRARGLGYLGLELKEPRASVGDTSSAVEGLSTVTNPLLLDACLRGWANAQAELLPTEGPVKVDDTNAPPSDAEDDLADAFERDMNYWFTEVATEYYPDTSHMLLWGTYFGGSGFKKIYRCPMRRRPVSESIPVQDLIVSDTTKDLRSCARITHQIAMRPSMMKRMQLIGAYRKTAPLPQPTPAPNAVEAKIAGIQGTDVTPQRPEDQPFNLWESQCELDLEQFAPTGFKGEGIPLPYVATMDKDSREILAIRRDWKSDDDDCARKRMYVKFPYVPGPGFYGTGMLNILGNASAAMTAAWRMSLDAAMFANFPAFLVSKIAGRQNTSDFRVAPGTGVPLETGNQPIGNVAAPMPYKDVGPGMLALIDKITSQCQPLGGAAEIPAAEGIANVPVGTMLAQIEQATKVMAAAHKGMYRAQAEEIELIVELFRDNPEDFWKNNRACKQYWNEQKFTQALADCNLVPRADPNTPSHIHRVAKVLGLVQLTMNPALVPRLNIDEILRRSLRVIGEDPNGLILPPPAPAPAAPNPQMIAAQAKLMQAQTGQVKAASDAQDADQENQIKAAQLQAEQNIASTDLAKEMVIHQTDNANAAKQHGLAVAQSVHNANMDVAKHALDVHQVLNPPAPVDSGSAP